MKTILLIEDNPEILDNTSEILELAGYRVMTAENGKLGVEAALQSPPDLIVCDVMMPVLDGYGVFHLVRKHPDLAHIPFIFLTAKSERSDLRKGMELGADDYITKPYSDTELLSAVESRLERMERLRKDILDQARETGPAQELNADQALQTLLKGQPVNTYRKKQPIFSEGNHPQFLFYLKRGRAKVYKTSDDGKELTIGLYGTGDFLGYIALLEAGRYEVSAEALQETEVVLISGTEFLDLVQGNSKVATWFFRLVARHNNEKADQLVQVAYHSLRKRVAGSLLLLLRKYSRGDAPNFSIHISREELANLAGTATESLIRTLADFRHEKLIDIREGDIVILNEKGLQGMMN